MCMYLYIYIYIYMGTYILRAPICTYEYAECIVRVFMYVLPFCLVRHGVTEAVLERIGLEQAPARHESRSGLKGFQGTKGDVQPRLWLERLLHRCRKAKPVSFRQRFGRPEMEQTRPWSRYRSRTTDKTSFGAPGSLPNVTVHYAQEMLQIRHRVLCNHDTA